MLIIQIEFMSIIITVAYSAADHVVQGLMRTSTSAFLEMPQGTHSSPSMLLEDIFRKTHSSVGLAVAGALHHGLQLDHCAKTGRLRETYQVPVGPEH